jgi:hypothetical protein
VGSDKRCSLLFPLVNPNTQLAAIFESPTDALSYMTLRTEQDDWRLSLGGMALTALIQCITLHPNARWLDVCTNNDDAGNACFEQIKSLNMPCVLSRLAAKTGTGACNDKCCWRGRFLSPVGVKLDIYLLIVFKTHAINCACMIIGDPKNGLEA